MPEKKHVKRWDGILAKQKRGDAALYLSKRKEDTAEGKKKGRFFWRPGTARANKTGKGGSLFRGKGRGKGKKGTSNSKV